MRTLATTLALALSACVGASQPDIDLDFGGVCHTFALSLIDPVDELADVEVHAFAASDPTGAGWALITLGADSLGLRHIPVDADDPTDVSPPIHLNLNVEARADVHLLPGAELGEVWAYHTDVSGLQLWHLTEDGLVGSQDYGNTFPGMSDTWERRLIFIGRQPMLVAAPTSSTDESVGFMLANLAEDLSIDMLWELSFGTECQEPEDSPCIPTSYPLIHLLDVADADGTSPALILFEFERIFEGISIRTTGAATVQIDLDIGSTQPLAIKREYYDLLWGHSVTDLRIVHGQIAREHSGYYIIAGVEGDPSDDPDVDVFDLPNDRLVRHDLHTGSSATIARLRKYTHSHLLQLTDQVGLGQAFDGHWRGTRLSGVTIDEDNIDSLQLAPEDLTFTRAGHNHLLLQTPAGSSRGRVDCAEPD